ncbi:uncharacterized protein LOC110465654 [Mizuhopecten yessoensis]|uniref:uncharacterized protein LOC110465654 n=1 Tax=Mizuhopecten yessoensis TaxID=6573 RepID=UPI000B458FFC|nr:uncharacterized protein LOC110465654 [Mizuhopecten yessoensis]
MQVNIGKYRYGYFWRMVQELSDFSDGIIFLVVLSVFFLVVGCFYTYRKKYRRKCPCFPVGDAIEREQTRPPAQESEVTSSNGTVYNLESITLTVPSESERSLIPPDDYRRDPPPYVEPMVDRSIPPPSYYDVMTGAITGVDDSGISGSCGNRAVIGARCFE